ncbi:MAG TPA: VOC family protein [Anaerolineales bacterium]|nr:VOC family protein [Anaerolineales bacterium]
MADITRKIVTFLTFKDRAEEAVNLYVSLFKNSKILSIVRMGADAPGVKGTLLHATFQLDGQEFMAMDGGPYFSFGQGTSLFVNCETQEEVDLLWEKLSEGGEKQQCGWLKDKFGVSWQIIPTALGEMMQDKDPEKAKRVMEAMLKMEKIDIRTLRQAYDQG